MADAAKGDAKLSDARVRAAINQQLIESGEKERLKELLRQRLIDSGWRDQLKAECKKVVNEQGVESITVEELVTQITPKGRALVPDGVKKELLQRIRGFLAEKSGP
eukprot:m.431867 g.431867  ORF g.431867 m.431867 type:complete len:106 (-) comp17361_c0_seq1:194-511(-)